MSATLLSHSVPSRSIELINSLEEQTVYPKLYWKSRERELAAIGAAEVRLELPDEKEMFFGGMAFSSSSKEDSCWKAFPRAYFFRPAEILFGTTSSPLQQQNSPNLIARKDSPSLPEWEGLVNLAIQAIEREELEKVVLGRKTTLTFDAKINPFAILRQLNSRTVFALQLDPSTTFLGATPETLYRRKGRELFTHAVAGTRPRGKDREEDLFLKAELLSCKKERLEFDIVRREIFKCLNPLSQTFTQSEIEVLQTSHLQHLSMNFTSTLKPGISDAKILATLHPTPATGGLPKDAALAFLGQHEPFDRGWYAGPIGWISDIETELAVGIRSALIIENEMHLFAGTGIVRGSHFEKEWNELEHKITPFLRDWRAQ